MNCSKQAASYMTTEEMASRIGIKPQSIRVRLCQTGSYFGVTPQKLPNGRLLWPADGVIAMTSGGAA